MREIWQFAIWTLTAGWRSRLSWLLLALALALLGSAGLAAAFSARQPLVVALDVGLSGLRVGLLFLVLVWTQDLLAKDFDRKNLYWLLGLPVSRGQYLLGKVLGISVLLALVVLALALPVWALGVGVNWGYASSSAPLLTLPGLAAVLAGFYMEAWLVLTVCVLLQTFSRTPFLAMALALCFAIAGRGLHVAFNFLLYDPDAPQKLQHGLLPILTWLQWLLPDLSQLDWRTGLLYGVWPATGVQEQAALMALAYGASALALAVLCFQRRNLD